MEWKRFENETEDELIYRICSHKDEIGSWNDVATILNSLLGHDYSESKYRKAFQSFETLFKANQSRLADISERIDELKDIEESVRKERQKLYTANLERNRIDREDARWAMFYENIGQYINNPNKDVPKFECNEVTNNPIEYILGIADVHAGALWATSANEYSMKIVEDRFAQLLEYTEDFVMSKKLTHFNIVLLGDLIDGVLRMSNLQMQDSKVAKATADISEIIGAFIDTLSIDCNVTIDVYDAVYGNHSTQRYLGQSKNYDMLEDLGYTISRYIQCYLRNNPNVKFYTPKENETYVDFNINGFNMIAFHGHNIKNYATALKDLSMQNRKWYDYSLSGHIHSESIITEGASGLHDIQDIRFPSMCGADPYADSLFARSKASALIIGIEKDFGYTEMKKFILN